MLSLKCASSLIKLWCCFPCIATLKYKHLLCFDQNIQFCNNVTDFSVYVLEASMKTGSSFLPQDFSQKVVSTDFQTSERNNCPSNFDKSGSNKNINRRRLQRIAFNRHLLTLLFQDGLEMSTIILFFFHQQKRSQSLSESKFSSITIYIYIPLSSAF